MLKKQAEKLSREIKRWNLANDGKDGGEGVSEDGGMV